MLLLTGATGTVGAPLLRRLIEAGIPVRVLVRDPRRLGPHRVQVQIAMGRLEDHLSFGAALRGVDTVIHLASVIRDQPGGSIEELAGMATQRLVEAAEQAGVQRFLFFSTIGASTSSPARLMRAKAVAEQAVKQSSLATTVFAPSVVYAPGDLYLKLLGRMSLLPAMPIPGPGRAPFQPIWAEDVADCVMAALPGGSRAKESVGARLELAGPQTLTHRQMVELVQRSLRRPRPILPVPLPLVRRTLTALELLSGPRAFATWDEVQLLEIPMVAEGGSADARWLGVEPKPMAAVLGAGD